MKPLNRSSFLHGARASTVLCLLVSMAACSQPTPTPLSDDSYPDFVRRTDGSIERFDGRVIPAMPELLSVREQYDLRSLYSHPVGYHGHGLGPSINARNGVLGDPPEWDSVLRLGSYRAIELSATTAIPEWNGEKLRIPMEDDAYLTENGFEWFRPVQTEWYLIR